MTTLVLMMSRTGAWSARLLATARTATSRSVGAKVRESLAAKAATLRKRGLSEIQTSANAASERMAMPVVLLVPGP